MGRILPLLLAVFISCPAFGGLLHENSTPHDVKVASGVTLRATHTKAANAKSTTKKKVVIFLPGRASFFEKNEGLILGITGHDTSGTEGIALPDHADFWCLDMRAHGASGGRLGPNDQRGHIDSFDTYLSDIHTVIKETIAPTYQNQDVDFYLMGSSLGGHLALRYLQDYADKAPLTFKRALIIVPMMCFKTDPWPRSVAKTLIATGVTLGFSETYAIGYGDLDLSKSDFKRFTGHHNEKAFDETNDMMRNSPHLITGGPTFGWANAGFDSEAPLWRNPLPKDVEILAYVAGDDDAVDTDFTLKFCTERDINVKIYPHSRHNILKETRKYAPGFWMDLDLS